MFELLTSVFGQKSVEFLSAAHLADASVHSLNGALAVVDDYLYIMPGRNRSKTVQKLMYRMDLNTSEIVQLANPPVGAFLAKTVYLDGYIYLSGGALTSGSDSPSSSFSRYHIETNTWEQLAAMPAARSGHALATYQGKIYAIGGGGVTLTHIYDPVTDNWSVFPTSGVTHPYVQIISKQVGKYIYLLGGYNGSSVATTTNKASRLNLETGEWVDYTSRFAFPKPIRLGGMFDFRGEFVILPGQYDGVVTSKIFRTNLEKGTPPVEIGNAPKVMAGATYVAKGNDVYAYGGSPGGASSTSTGEIHKFTFR